MFIRSWFIFINIVFIHEVIASISVVDKGILPLEENSVGIKFFVDVTNADRQNFCNLHSRCEKCCLTDSMKDNCDIMTCFGENLLKVNSRERKTILYVAPILQQHDLIGYCDFKLYYNCNKTTNRTEVLIPFDTRIFKKTSKVMGHYIGAKKVSTCETLDEDSLNNCEPVNCNNKYLDKRPVYDFNLSKCIQVPTCLTNLEKELPDYVYVPDSNICRNLDLPLTVQDIYAISSGLGTVTVPPRSSKFDIKIEATSYCSTISQNLILIRDLLYGKLYPVAKEVELDYSDCLKSAVMTIAAYIISVCMAVLLLVCCVNTTSWLYLQWVDGNVKKMWKSVRKYIGKRKNNSNKWEKVNSTVRNTLLREVIVKDIPLKLRYSALGICNKRGRKVEKTSSYRVVDTGSTINIREDISNTSSSSLDSLEKDKD